ncbi:MAG: hypothetical protein AB7F65_11835 [Dehalococcoidia bacterium]
MSLRRAVILLIASALLASCGGGDPSTAAGAETTSPVAGTSVASPAVAAATATRTASPSATPTQAATGTPTETPTETLTETPGETSGPEATSTPVPTATPAPTSTAPPPPLALEIRATRLRIPSLGIDAEVQGSEIVPYTGTVPAGCTPPPPDTTTLTVPSQGIATPDETWAGIERKSWIFGHSRWQGEPGLLFALQWISVGDELYVDGYDRLTGVPVSGRRFVVDALYLSDTESGSAVVNASSPDEIPSEAQVILQTSVRERGAGKAWILDREVVTSKAITTVEGDLDDPCKYLLLFVVASAA